MNKLKTNRFGKKDDLGDYVPTKEMEFCLACTRKKCTGECKDFINFRRSLNND